MVLHSTVCGKVIWFFGCCCVYCASCGVWIVSLLEGSQRCRLLEDLSQSFMYFVFVEGGGGRSTCLHPNSSLIISESISFSVIYSGPFFTPSTVRHSISEKFWKISQQQRHPYRRIHSPTYCRRQQLCRPISFRQRCSKLPVVAG